MTHTMLPTSKGQVTIPAALRKKYNINEKTPLTIEDVGEGNFTVKVMRMIPDDGVMFYEDKDGIGLHFKNGIDPAVLIKKLKEIDG